MCDDEELSGEEWLDKDIERNHKLYAAVAGACSCDRCKGESWYTGDDSE